MRTAALRAHAPATVLAAAVAVVCMAVNALVPLLSAMLLAIIFGILARNLGWIPQAAEKGIGQKLALRTGVVLLGLRLSVPEVLDLGLGVLLVIALTVVVTYLGVVWAGRRMGLPRATSVLIATGSAICGAAAVAAMSSVLSRARRNGTGNGRDSATGIRMDSRTGTDEEISESAATAVATVTLFGTISLLLIPLLAGLLSLSDDATGVWIGASVHEVGQVVAGAGLAGAGAMSMAVVTKLGRVVLLAPLVALVGWWEARRAPEGSGGRGGAAIMPWFVAGFIILVAVRSLTDLPGEVLQGANLVATFLLTMGMFGMGAGVRLKHLAHTGKGAVALGAVAAVISALVSLVVILLWL